MALSYVALQNLTFVINCTPEVVRLTIDLHKHLIEMPAPLPKATHPTDPLTLDICREHQTEPVSPMPYHLMANIDPALSKQVLDIP